MLVSFFLPAAGWSSPDHLLNIIGDDGVRINTSWQEQESGIGAAISCGWKWKFISSFKVACLWWSPEEDKVLLSDDEAWFLKNNTSPLVSFIIFCPKFLSFEAIEACAPGWHIFYFLWYNRMWNPRPLSQKFWLLVPALGWTVNVFPCHVSSTKWMWSMTLLNLSGI